MLSNILKVLRNPNSFLIWFLSSGVAFFLWYIYSDIEYVAANYQSHFFAYFDAFLSWCMVVFLPLIIAGIVYRSLYFGVRGIEDRPSGVAGIFGGVVSVFITGASCCGVSLISVFGMTSLITFLELFPYHGIELKVLGIILLLYSFRDLYTNLEVCKIRKK